LSSSTSDLLWYLKYH
jgi:hypothetical protein